jgi:hypothetical protein
MTWFARLFRRRQQAVVIRMDEWLLEGNQRPRWRLW